MYTSLNLEEEIYSPTNEYDYFMMTSESIIDKEKCITAVMAILLILKNIIPRSSS